MDIIHTVAKQKWELKSGLGNHRFIVKCEASPYVKAVLPWRRRDFDYDDTGIVVKCTATGNFVSNVFIESSCMKEGRIVFEAPESGLYEIYYMPFNLIDEPWYSPHTEYLTREIIKPALEWLSGKAIAEIKEAKVLRYESRTEFDSFYPMEFPMTEEEREHFTENKPFTLVVESRVRPVRMKYMLPYIWLNKSYEEHTTLKDTACKNEHYVFQIAVVAEENLENIKVKFNQENCQCFNLTGRDVDGKIFDIKKDAAEGEVVSLWCGVDLENFNFARGEIFSVEAEVSADNTSYSEKIKVILNITDEELPNNGDDDLWRMSRLFWLNSDIGINDNPVKPYKPIDISEDLTMDIMGKKLRPGPMGLPSSFVSHYGYDCQIMDEKTEILAFPIELFVEKTTPAVKKREDISLHGETKNKVHTVISSETLRNDVALCGSIDYEADGHVDCHFDLEALEKGEYVFRLAIPVAKDAARMMMGMCYQGGRVPSYWEYSWDERYVGNQLWLGGVKGGIQVKLMPEDDVWGRSVAFNALWKQGGKMSVRKTETAVLFEATTGKIPMNKGQKEHLHFHIITTPFHPIDKERHFKEHIYHVACWNEEQVPDLNKAKSLGATMVNLHQGGVLNENINYPFLEAKKLKEQVDKAHSMGLKYKMYYTVRELSNYCAEIWAFRALGDEIYAPCSEFSFVAEHFTKERNKVKGKAGGPWLNEHLVEGFVGAWHQFLHDGEYDCAVATQPVSRLHNYYLCGLDWLIRNVGIDGLYLDGIGYDRRIMKRVRRIMEAAGKKCDIDIHSGNDHDVDWGYFSPGNEYLEHFAYADSLWLGEGFEYDNMSPEYYLIESSGIPFGLMGEMLHGGGNPWKGMVYGMTARLGWQQGGLSHEIWKIWDQFGIADSKMMGWWDDCCPVNFESDYVRATCYVKDSGDVLVAVASWAPYDGKYMVSVNKEALGISGSYDLYAPFIEGMQEECLFKEGEFIPVEGNKGWMFYLKSSDF
ncbi:MAG: hypothetical protein E7388_06515 [Ruminococcaceae bacterium]|nr:hypothetical protein [Oscillospiraceae bacterium]